MKCFQTSFDSRQARTFFLGILCFSLGACTPLAKVTVKAPPEPSLSAGNCDNPRLKGALLQSRQAERVLHTQPSVAALKSALAARASLQSLQDLRGQEALEAIQLYNFSVARLVEAIHAAGLKPWQKPVHLVGAEDDIWIRMQSSSTEVWLPGADQIAPTDRMIIGGSDFTKRVQISGVGAPLVVSGAGRKTPWSPLRHFVPATAVATFSGDRCLIRVMDPGATPSVYLAGKKRPLASDLSAPIAVNIVKTHPEGLGLEALLDGSRFAGDTRLVMMEPYRSDRQPVIFVHGLMDTPLAWVSMMNFLNSHPEFRAKYQIWYFEYPTNPPFIVSAAILRQDLNALYQKYPRTRKAIMVAHSLGGLLTHMLVCDSGTQFCQDIFGKPLADLDLPEKDRKLARSALEFKSNTHVEKVIFMATPHLGAYMADGIFGRLGSMLVHLPSQLLSLGPKLVEKAAGPDRAELDDRFPDSIDSLRPEAPGVQALNKLPMDPGIPYYSVIGDVAGPDLQHSSDLIVGYWSSHLKAAKSEKIVPYWHSDVIRGSESFNEVWRILSEK